ncbi:hypothetical protein [Mycolicibacterium arenosum]|uniref:Uncharacterized protein n=1 Tax=Mycolicibacterium arenosum TaxID=2952157 RepID=A0ABT1M7B2_9MYCO|nr:hypothetical protein [Mycolicibacterium sp. CAU 1645]MCP9275066.1 hypothetical protein [Mycolicibacterium sp. CAU 1645]
MTTAFLDVDVHGNDDLTPHGVVSVHHYGIGRSTAACSCGWNGRRRHLMAAAEQDAWVHAMHARCAVSSPLVLG